MPDHNTSQDPSVRGVQPSTSPGTGARRHEIENLLYCFVCDGTVAVVARRCPKIWNGQRPVAPRCSIRGLLLCAAHSAPDTARPQKLARIPVTLLGVRSARP